jgi:L-rhamnono-1,4-lactonase
MISNHEFPTVDSHIHLYTASDLPTLAWTSALPSSHPLLRQNSLSEYCAATSSPKSDTSANGKVRGFVFIETDRLSSLSSSSDPGWNYALDEISFISRVASGQAPSSGQDDGYKPEGKGLVLAIVPWAPLPAGAEAMEQYMKLARERCAGDEVWEMIKGVRYLVQDKPAGVMTAPAFVESLRWLGRQGLAFDLGVDARSGGLGQLEEAVKMLQLVHGGEGGSSGLNVVINHMCKPNLRLASTEAAENHSEFGEWKSCIEKMAAYPGTFMKLSGAFSELPSDFDWTRDDWLDEVVKIVKPWTDVVFNAFGASRIMFGSDWPVCNVGGPGIELSWKYWRDIVEAVLSARDFSNDEKAMIWAGTAQRAYNIP